MLNQKNLEDIKKILGQDGVKIEQGKIYAIPQEAGLIPELIRLALKDKFKILPLGNESEIELLKISDENILFLKLNQLSRIKKIVPQDLFVVTESGLNLKDLNPQLSAYNLFYPLSMDSYSGTVGGSVATGLSVRTRAKELSTRELVLALEMVNSSGQILKLGAEVFKSVTGYDTPRLLVGSWGSLGIIVSVSLRVFPLSRKEEFAEIQVLPAKPVKLRGEDNAKIILNRRLKSLLDQEGIFVEIF